jgi:hypothetical protein
MAVGIWQVSEISWRPAELLMLMRALNPFDMQRSYRARKSDVAVAVLTAVAAGGGGLDGVPFRTTSAQEGELETGTYCVTSCCRIGVDPPARWLRPLSHRAGGRSREGPD